MKTVFSGCLKMYSSGKVLLKFLILISFLQNTSTQISPIITERNPPSSTIYLDKNGERELTCIAKGAPTPRVTWLYNEVEVHSTNADADKAIHSNSNVLKIIAKEFGMYQCKASNKFGTVTSRPLVVKKAVMLQPPGFIPQQKIESKQGDTIELNCIHNMNIKPPAVSLWMKKEPGGKEQRIYNSQRIYTDGRGHLWIHNLKALDEGAYTCFVKNMELSREIKVTTVKVQAIQGLTQGAPFLKNNHDKFVESRGETVVLSANIIDPSNVCTKITWRRSDGGQMDSSRIRSFANTPQLLTFYQLAGTDSGYYDVMCWNHSQPLRLGSLFLHVTDPSRIITAPKLQQVAIGTDAEFSCEAIGDPMPTLTWTVNNSTLRERQGYNWTIMERGQHLKLLNVQTNVTVQCTATNYHGFQTAQTDLLAFDLPPKETTTQAVSETTTTSTTTQVAGTTPTVTVTTRKNARPIVTPASNVRKQSMGFNTATMPFIVIIVLLVIIIFALIVYIVYMRRHYGRQYRQGGPAPDMPLENGRSDEAARLTGDANV